MKTIAQYIGEEKKKNGEMLQLIITPDNDSDKALLGTIYMALDVTSMNLEDDGSLAINLVQQS